MVFIQFRVGYIRLVERLVVGLVELVIAIYRGTVVWLTAVGDSIVSLGRRIAHRFRRQPSAGVQVFIFCYFYVQTV
jgi:hypothetical protein